VGSGEWGVGSDYNALGMLGIPRAFHIREMNAGSRCQGVFREPPTGTVYPVRQ